MKMFSVILVAIFMPLMVVGCNSIKKQNLADEQMVALVDCLIIARVIYIQERYDKAPDYKMVVMVNSLNSETKFNDMYKSQKNG